MELVVSVAADGALEETLQICLMPNVITCSANISACEKAERPHKAMGLLIGCSWCSETTLRIGVKRAHVQRNH